MNICNVPPYLPFYILQSKKSSSNAWTLVAVLAAAAGLWLVIRGIADLI